MIKANIITGHPNWKKFLKKPNDYLKKRLNKLSKAPSFKRKNHEFSILLTNNKEMKKLNHKFRKRNKTTDVLSFPIKIKNKKKIYVGDIEIAPLAFMRGRTLKNSFAILDEAQNATDTQIKMFLTRIGENSKIVINGDPSQIDLTNKSQSGLNRSKKLLGNLKEISVVDFDHKDVVRHPLVSKIVKAYSDQSSD